MTKRGYIAPRVCGRWDVVVESGRPSMKMRNRAMLCLVVASLAGCESKGPAQRAGESIDKGVQDAKDAINPPGAVEKAGRAVDRAVNP
jgi:predicted small lipoprotein YifL